MAALMLLWPVRAPGQQESVAEELFREGRHAMKIGDFGKACSDLEESERLDPSPGTLLNLAICEERLGHLAIAWTKFQELADTSPKTDPRTGMARKAIARLEPSLPRLRITIAPASAQSIVKLDGVELRAASLGAYIPVDPGPHQVTLLAPGGTAHEFPLRIGVGERMEIHLSADDGAVEPASTLPTREVPEPATASAPLGLPIRTTHVPETAHQLRIASYIAGGVGLGGLIAAGTFTAIGLREKGTVDEHCPNRRCDSEGLKAVERANRLLRLADVGLVVGLAGSAAFGVLLWQATRTQVRVEHVAGGALLSYSKAFP